FHPFIDDTNFKILIIDKERILFEKCFKARINCFNILINKDFQTSEENIALINETKTKIEIVKTKQELLDYLDAIFSTYVLLK
ncbi:25438_t:CDS:1, partial [Gigaspora margarita]